MERTGKQGIQVEGGCGIPPSTFATKLLTDRNAYRSAVPLVEGEQYPCLFCVELMARHDGVQPKDFSVPPSLVSLVSFSVPDKGRLGHNARYRFPFDYEPVPGVLRGDYQVCEHCFEHLLLTGTEPGRQAVDAALNTLLPARYRAATFGRFQCNPPYADHLRQVRQDVMSWTKACRGTCYVYSERGPYGPGNGNGKTYLSCCSFSYGARREPYFETAKPDFGRIGFDQRFISVEQFVDDFMNRNRNSTPASRPVYHVGGMDLCFDEYRQYIAESGVLYLDDVGCRGPNRMVQETYEIIFDTRCENELPTFVTSNFSPEHIADRIGGRAASRLFRNEPFIPIEVRAPDYSLVRVRKGSQ